MKFQPIIKWTGTKRIQSCNIVGLFPKKIDTYYEPFLGSGAVMFQLMNSDIKVNEYVVSDLNSYLIDMWLLIKNDWEKLLNGYKKHHDKLKEFGNDYYYKVRKEFNVNHNPIDFYFLTRTCINGLIRFNKKGEFNPPFHLNRLGVKPSNLKSILLKWSNIINKNKVKFSCVDYKKINPNKEDFLYIDPPYKNTASMYFNNFNHENFWDWLNNIKCKYALSFNGKTDEKNYMVDIPQHIYKRHLFLNSGKSSYQKLFNNKNINVKESLYLNY